MKNKTGRTWPILLAASWAALALFRAVPALGAWPVPGAWSALAAMEKEIPLGLEDDWQDLESRAGVSLVTGRWGALDLVLSDAEYLPGPDTDLLLHFNEEPVRDSAGRYRTGAEPILISRQVGLYGGASGGFQGRELLVIPGPGAMFSPGAVWQDFSIEFWLYPVLLEDGETILVWSGAGWEDGRLAGQRLAVRIEDRVLHWGFENLFGRPVSMCGLTPLIPRVWHHHLLRYDASRGVLEYLVDGVPEAVVYTTSTGREGGSLVAPRIGEAGASELRLGAGFTGFLDELRISRRFVDQPVLSRYSGETGQGVSRIFDLGYTGTRLRRIEVVDRRPGDAAVLYSYRLDDSLGLRDGLGWRTPTVPWVPFQPGSNLTDIGSAGAPRGRFLQVRVELFPDGARRSSPEVSAVRIVYEPDLPPTPPLIVLAEPGDGRIRLSWKPVNEADVRGYRVYYGEAPGSYLGTGSEQGDSPVDAGGATELTLSGLRNNRLYYFAVVSYDATEPPHQSPFSREISARPSRLGP